MTAVTGRRWPRALCAGTAKWFVRSILAKLGADDRTEAVTTALERGILHH
jgi:DNA-binding NarL/FixJ family response regulator